MAHLFRPALNKMPRLGRSWKEAGHDTSVAGLSHDDKTLLEMAVGALTAFNHRRAVQVPPETRVSILGGFHPTDYTDAQLIAMGRNGRTVNGWIATNKVLTSHRIADDVMVYYVGGELICVEDAILPFPSDLTVAKLALAIRALVGED